MPRLNDLTNKTFGNWEVLYRNGSTSNNAAVWRCKCNLCGLEKNICGYSLVQGKTTKCRKCSAQIAQRRKYTNDSIKSVFSGMWQRCYDKNHSYYSQYGGRGICICDEWLNNRIAFYDWAYDNGYTKGMSIERVDFNGNYEPSNCKFIPIAEQSRNRRNSILIEIAGEVKCLQEWCDIYSVNRSKVRWQHSKGLSWQDAILRCLR